MDVSVPAGFHIAELDVPDAGGDILTLQLPVIAAGEIHCGDDKRSYAVVLTNELLAAGEFASSCPGSRGGL